MRHQIGDTLEWHGEVGAVIYRLGATAEDLRNIGGLELGGFADGRKELISESFRQKIHLFYFE